MLIESILNTCSWEELNKFLMTSCDSLQVMAFVTIFFLQPKVRTVIRKFERKKFCRKKISSQDSDVSLAPSRNSRNSINKDDISEPIQSWNEFVIRARSSFCDGNIYTVEPHSQISTSPDPPVTKDRSSLVLRPKNNQARASPARHHTIRDIMYRAKNNLSKDISNPETPSFPKRVTPPLPKNIPNQILDDVQLFDFYYKNLNSIFINENPPTNIATESDDTESNSSVKRKSRLMTFARD